MSSTCEPPPRSTFHRPPGLVGPQPSTRRRTESQAEVLRGAVNDLAALFDAASVDFEALTPFEEQVLMLWNRLELRLEQAGGPR